MSEFVYPPVIAFAKTAFWALDLKITVTGAEHVPTSGGAVIACNHVSYLDFIFCGLGAQPARRLVRFMAKHEIFANRFAGPLMRGMHHIPVDRDAGLASYRQALSALKDGEVVGIFPEATISRSFVVKELKTGAARMAGAAKVPIVPMALWGPQRMWTKGRPRRLLQRHVPITIAVGEPLIPAPRGNGDATMIELRQRMSALAEGLQRAYPVEPRSAADSWWQPAYLGGTAPTPEEADELDAAH